MEKLSQVTTVLWLASFSQKGLRILDNCAELLAPAAFNPERRNVSFKSPIAGNRMGAAGFEWAQALDLLSTFRLNKGTAGMEAAAVGRTQG